MAKKLTQLRQGQFNVLRDTGLTLANLAKTAVLDATGIKLQLLLELPLPDELPNVLPSVAICLYHLGKRPDGYLHDPDRREVEEGPDGTLQEFTRRPPLNLDLRYLVTVYAESHKDELSLLGLVMRTFFDTSVLERDMVIGDSIEPRERPGLDVELTAPEEMRKIWESFGQPYRPSFTCRVEGRIDSSVKRLIRRVRETIVDFKKMDG